MICTAGPEIMKTVRFTCADRDIMTYIIGFILIQHTVTSKELSNDIVFRMAVKQVFAHLTVQFFSGVPDHPPYAPVLLLPRSYEEYKRFCILGMPPFTAAYGVLK